MKFFRPSEFACKCKYDCGLGFENMDPNFLKRLELARMIADVPFILNSAIRCEQHNRDIGGVIDSAHLTGHAVDIRTKSSDERFRIIYGLVKAGFKRMGIYDTFTHVDNDKHDKPQKVTWLGD